MWEVYRRNPDLKRLPYSLDSFDPPFAKKFALRQLELMNMGMTREQAYRDTQKEMSQLKVHLAKYVFYSSAFVLYYDVLVCAVLGTHMLANTPCIYA